MLAPLDRAGAQALLAPSARLVLATVTPAVAVPAAAWAAVRTPTLLALAQHERCEAALLALAQAAPAGAVDPVLLDGLRARARVAAFRTAGLEEGAAAALDTLAAAGVAALWLKGAGLALADGDDGFGHRPMGDLDVLVEPTALPAAVAALTAAGWVASAASAADYGARHHHLAPLTWRGDPAVRLELHRAVWPPGHPFAPVEATAWLAAARPVRWRGRTALVPAPAWGLAHAATHWAWSHEGTTGSWQWLRDVGRFATVELGTLASVAEALGVRRPVGWALRVAARLGALPPGLAEAVGWSGRGAGGLGALADRQWVMRAFAAGAPTPGVGWDRWWWRWSMGGLGASTGAWPWAVGVAPPPPVPWRARAGVVERAGRWRGYVRRLAGRG